MKKLTERITDLLKEELATRTPLFGGGSLSGRRGCHLYKLPVPYLQRGTVLRKHTAEILKVVCKKGLFVKNKGWNECSFFPGTQSASNPKNHSYQTSKPAKEISLDGVFAQKAQVEVSLLQSVVRKADDVASLATPDLRQENTSRSFLRRIIFGWKLPNQKVLERVLKESNQT